jgi:hypothetical protein
LFAYDGVIRKGGLIMKKELCGKCGEPRNYVIKSGKRAGKMHTYCCKCLSAQVCDWGRRNPERRRERQRQYLRDNPHRKLRYEMRRYGVDENWYLEKLAEQKGVCAICQRDEMQRTRKSRLSVDHCHKTGALRGLLCNTCNMRIAGLESSNWFSNALAYLKQYENP